MQGSSSTDEAGFFGPIRRYVIGVTAAVTVGAAIAASALVAAPTEKGEAVTSEVAIAAEAKNSAMAVNMSDVAKEEWERRTATAEGRQEVLEQLQTAFAGVAEFHLGDQPASASTPTRSAANVALTSVSTKAATVVPAYAQGMTSTHLWMTMSYADAIRGGGIATALYACTKTWWLVPICGALGAVLNSMVQGWAPVNNHGVWAEVYWNPLRVRAGRW